jgi:Na+/melibiose symporter-like transporter
MTNQELYQRARARVKAIRGFYAHVAVYVIFNLFLLLLNLISEPWNLWFYWLLLYWGVVVAIHGVLVFAFGSVFGKEWEEHKIRQIMESERETTPVNR